MADLPNGPRNVISETLAMYLGDPYELQLRTMQKFGDTFMAPTVVYGPRFVTGNPEAIKALFAAEPTTFSTALGDVLSIFPGQGEGSLFTLTGDRHRAARKLLAPSFHGARMRAYGTLIRDIARRWAAAWQPGRQFVLLDTTQAIALDVIIQAVFGVTGQSQVQRFHQHIRDSFATFVPSLVLFKSLRRPFWGIGPWARFESMFTELQGMIMSEVAAHRAGPDGRQDILSLLLQARYEDGSPLSDIELFTQLLTFVFAGHETTAISLAWAFYLLHRHPAALARLRQELATLGSDPDPDAIVKLPYLEAACNETLRLRPIQPVVSRKLARPLTVAGYALPAGTTIGINLVLAHQRPEVFPKPQVFRPERFLDRTFAPHEFLPFGGGTRRCIGAAFAMYEMKIVLATLLAAGELTLVETGPVLPRMRAAIVGPKGGVRMRLEKAAQPAGSLVN